MKTTKSTNDSFSLLSQQEIDTLIRFLTEKKNAVDSDVMSQNSIDKLITLIQTDHERIALGSLIAYGNIDSTFLQEFRGDSKEVFQMQFSQNDATGYVELTALNPETGKTVSLTPSLFDKADTDEWGRSIPPFLFVHIALGLDLKFSQETYDKVCDCYAKLNFDSSDHKVPELVLPDNDLLLECLL